MNLTIETEEAPYRCAIIKITGELDLATAPTLRDQLLNTLGVQNLSRLIVDLAGLSFMDSSGVAVLVGTARRAKLLGCDFALAAPQPAVSRVLDICGLVDYFAIFPTLADAVAAPERSGIAVPRVHDAPAEAGD